MQSTARIARYSDKAVMQISCLEEILEIWLSDLVKDPEASVFGKIDLTTVLLTGHSRGAKLATLHFAGRQKQSLPCPSHWLAHATDELLARTFTELNLVSPGVGSSKYAGAFLIDPVDNTPDAPESPSSPSACKALRKCGKAVSIVGAGITGPCNPAGSNFEARMSCLHLVTLCACLGSNDWHARAIV